MARFSVGVDGWKGKWVAVWLRDGAFFSVRVHQTLAEIAEDPEPQVIAVDVPIGLEDRGFRAADAAARQLIGPRGSSVFNSPPAFALAPCGKATLRPTQNRKDDMAVESPLRDLRC